MRGKRGSPESEREAKEREGRGGREKDQDPFNRSGAIVNSNNSNIALPRGSLVEI